MDSNQQQHEVWGSIETLFWDHMQEVEHKWNSLKLNDDIWAKLIYFEQNKRLAKAYVSAPQLTIDGSASGLDGFRIGLSGIQNGGRSLDSAACLKSIGAGIKLRIDSHGNILLRRSQPLGRASGCSVHIKQWPARTPTPRSPPLVSILDDCMVHELEECELPTGAASSSYKLFDMRKFRTQLERRPPPLPRGRTAGAGDQLIGQLPLVDWRQCVTLISFRRKVSPVSVASQRLMLKDSCWLMLINIVAVDMLKSSRRGQNSQVVRPLRTSADLAAGEQQQQQAAAARRRASRRTSPATIRDLEARFASMNGDQQLDRDGASRTSRHADEAHRMKTSTSIGSLYPDYAQSQSVAHLRSNLSGQPLPLRQPDKHRSMLMVNQEDEEQEDEQQIYNDSIYTTFTFVKRNQQQQQQCSRPPRDAPTQASATKWKLNSRLASNADLQLKSRPSRAGMVKNHSMLASGTLESPENLIRHKSQSMSAFEISGSSRAFDLRALNSSSIKMNFDDEQDDEEDTEYTSEYNHYYDHDHNQDHDYLSFGRANEQQWRHSHNFRPTSASYEANWAAQMRSTGGAKSQFLYSSRLSGASKHQTAGVSPYATPVAKKAADRIEELEHEHERHGGESTGDVDGAQNNGSDATCSSAASLSFSSCDEESVKSTSAEKQQSETAANTELSSSQDKTRPEITGRDEARDSQPASSPSPLPPVTGNTTGGRSSLGSSSVGSSAGGSSSSGCADNDYFVSNSSMSSSTRSNETEELFSQPTSSSGIMCSGSNTGDECEPAAAESRNNSPPSDDLHEPAESVEGNRCAPPPAAATDNHNNTNHHQEPAAANKKQLASDKQSKKHRRQDDGYAHHHHHDAAKSSRRASKLTSTPPDGSLTDGRRSRQTTRSRTADDNSRPASTRGVGESVRFLSMDTDEQPRDAKRSAMRSISRTRGLNVKSIAPMPTSDCTHGSLFCDLPDCGHKPPACTLERCPCNQQPQQQRPLAPAKCLLACDCLDLSGCDCCFQCSFQAQAQPQLRGRSSPLDCRTCDYASRFHLNSDPQRAQNRTTDSSTESIYDALPRIGDRSSTVQRTSSKFRASTTNRQYKVPESTRSNTLRDDKRKTTSQLELRPGGKHSGSSQHLNQLRGLNLNGWLEKRRYIKLLPKFMVTTSTPSAS